MARNMAVAETEPSPRSSSLSTRTLAWCGDRRVGTVTIIGLGAMAMCYASLFTRQRLFMSDEGRTAGGTNARLRTRSALALSERSY